MTITLQQLQDVITGTEEQRIEQLRSLLDYPIKLRDPEGSRFWYLRSGEDEFDAEETCPVAVGFYEELDELDDKSLKQWLTEPDQENEIRGHYISRIVPDQPILYLLLPTTEEGLVVFVLPSEGKLKQRNIQCFSWDSPELLNQFQRLHQGTLILAKKIKEQIIGIIPQVDWIFYTPAKTAKTLAQELAVVTSRMEQAIPDVYHGEDDDGYLHKLLVSFRKELLPNLKLSSDDSKEYSFADIYAQTIAYGLFTARVFSFVKDPEEDFNRSLAWQQLPETNPFLRQLFKDVSERSPDELGDELIDAISETFAILRAAKMDEILADFRSKMNREDIVIRFYEDFLAAYKPKLRERRGVYYTPEPVVSYMVRSVDELLKDKFDKPLGLADPEVMILDPACGTGTFILWIFQLIYKRFQESPEALTEGLADQSWTGYVNERLLPRIFGFELLMAPYAICHLKLGLFLEETGYQFTSGKRLGVYLTNTLDDSIKKSETLLEEYIAEESNQAAEIKKNKPIMVVMGNPPYSVSSVNKSDYIENLIERYKKAVRSEKNIQPLSDDYIKFICFSHYQIEKAGYGILALISNNSYLKGIIHRGMRKEILATFDELFFLDLLGNPSQKEHRHKVDENVFDIKQGVAICQLIKLEDSCKSQGTVFHYIKEDTRKNKGFFLNKNSCKTTHWDQINCSPESFYFIPKDFSLTTEYDTFISICDIFPVYANGLITRRDSLCIDFDKDKLIKRFIEIAKNSDIEYLKKTYSIKDTQNWTLENSKIYIKVEEVRQKIILCFYRPFDIRWIYYNPDIIERGDHRWNLMQHMVHGKNIAISIVRQITSGYFCNVFCTSLIAEKKSCSHDRSSYLFPLYTYPDPNKPKELQQEKRPNFSSDFLKTIESKLGYLPTPEAIFYYIYGVFHSPTYRTRYAEFLKIDFPRVPLTSNNDLFIQLSNYGEQLVQLHLMESPLLDNPITQFIDNGGNREVGIGSAKTAYKNGTVKLNKQGDCFTGVPEEVWNFYVGGYQVCHKWLKDRKKRTLSDEDINHYHRIVVALQETINLMSLIDEAIPSFPIE
ncbi:MAG: type ISP restriction/modification enzyme [Crocosphaera sp.]